MDYSSSPTGSLLRGFRPSLHVLFQHIRGSGDRDFITKDDLKVILHGEVDSNDLDEAFERLDADGNGRITEDEFMNGFATFLVEASSAQNNEDLSIAGHTFKRNSSVRRSRNRKPIHELLYEAQEGEMNKPSDNFQKSLKHLSLHNRLSIQELWKSLNDSNPEAVSDFEDFIGEMASEVSTAQNALQKQKEVIRLEAMELDVEMAMIHNDSKMKLQQQTEILREKAETKIERELQQKDEELGEIRDKLQLLSQALDVCLVSALQLENELLVSRHSQAELKQKYEESVQERKTLMSRLTSSETLLNDRTTTIDNMINESSKQKEHQLGFVEQQEEDISQLKTAYITEISELRERLKSLQRNQDEIYYSSNHHGNDMTTTPDLLSTTYNDCSIGRMSPSSLLDEIVESEGTVSPVLKSTMIHTPSPITIHRLTNNKQQQQQQQQQSPILLLPTNYQNDEHVIIDHLDLAAKPPPTKPNRSTCVMRSKPNNKSSRPSSMYCSGIEHMDLDWPPGNWQETHQEWLAQVASADVTRNSPTNRSPLKKIPKPRPLVLTPNHAPNIDIKPLAIPTVNKQQHTQLDNEEITKYYNNPQECQPLEFVESFVLQPHQTFKILVVGNPYVGKSCFLMRLCTNTFTTRYASTIGVDFFSRAIMLNNKVVSLQLWDTAGQERFQSVTRAYYRGAHGVILMYDVSREDSFIAVKTWINSIQDNMEEPPSALLLVGNKVDLDDTNQREVLTETGETFAKIYGAMFAEVSAKSGYNVGSACLLLVEKLIKELGFSDPSKQQGFNMTQSSNKSKCPC